MTLTVSHHAGPEHMHVACAPPDGLTVTALMRLDRNGRARWTADQLGPWTALIYDDTCALAGPVEYVVTYDDGSREAISDSFPGGLERPRLVRLVWETRLAGHVLTTTGSIWTEHDAVIDASDALEDVTTVTRRGVDGIHTAPTAGRLDTGRLVIWCETRARAVHLRDDLTRYPLQWLRAPDQIGMDHAVIVTSIGLTTETGAWLVDVGYTTRPDLTPVPHLDASAHGARTLGEYAGTLADVAETFDMLAEMR